MVKMHLTGYCVGELSQSDNHMMINEMHLQYCFLLMRPAACLADRQARFWYKRANST